MDISYGANVFVAFVSDAFSYGGEQPLFVLEYRRTLEAEKDLTQSALRPEHRVRREEIRRKRERPLKNKREAGQVFPPPLVSRFREMPASLTEGGQPVVCWPGYETPAARKKFRWRRKKLSRIVWESIL